MMTQDNVNTGGGDVVEGHKIVLEGQSTYVNGNVYQTVYVLDGANPQVIKSLLKGESNKRAQLLVHVPISVSLPPNPTEAKSEVQYSYIIDQPALFAERSLAAMGNALLIPVSADDEITLTIFRGDPPLSDIALKLFGDGNLAAKIWNDKSTIWQPVASAPYDIQFGTASVSHRWWFEQVNLEDALLVGGIELTSITFDPKLVKTAWRIHHERARRRPQTFLIALKREDV